MAIAVFMLLVAHVVLQTVPVLGNDQNECSFMADVKATDHVRKWWGWGPLISVKYGVLGTFNTKAPFNDLPLPQEPSRVAPAIYAYSNRHQRGICFDQISDWSRSDKVYIAVHGFLSTGDKPWVEKMTQALLRNDPSGVVLVADWKKGAWQSVRRVRFYSQAASNTRVVGKILGEVLGKSAINPKNIHCIGHSLGAHLCGYASEWLGKRVQKKFGRITALDAASPRFYNKTDSGRLDKSDAEFVDAIHTDSGRFGMFKPMGHVDVYPNGGKDQPQCDRKGWLIAYVVEARCNHDYAIDYFENSLRNPTLYPVYTCKWSDIEKGKCRSRSGSSGGSGIVQYMGIAAVKKYPACGYILT